MSTSAEVAELFNETSKAMDAGQVGLPDGFYKGKCLEADIAQEASKKDSSKMNLWLALTVEVQGGPYAGAVEQWRVWLFEKNAVLSLSKKLAAMEETNRDVPLDEDERKAKAAMGRFKQLIGDRLGFRDKPGYEWLDEGGFDAAKIGQFLTNMQGWLVHFERRPQMQGRGSERKATDFKENVILSRRRWEQASGLDDED